MVQMKSLKSLEPQREGGVYPSCSRGDPDTRLEGAFKEVSGYQVASRATGLWGHDRGSRGRAVEGPGLLDRVAGPGEVEVGKEVEERAPRVNVKPRVAAETFKTLPRDEAARAIRLGLPCIKASYERGLKRNPALGGVLRVRILVTPLGKVATAEVESGNLGDAQTSTAILGCFARMRFPLSEEKVEIVVPFDFVRLGD
jgi:hypothetical protein